MLAAAVAIAIAIGGGVAVRVALARRASDPMVPISKARAMRDARPLLAAATAAGFHVEREVRLEATEDAHGTIDVPRVPVDSSTCAAVVVSASGTVGLGDVRFLLGPNANPAVHCGWEPLRQTCLTRLANAVAACPPHVWGVVDVEARRLAPSAERAHGTVHVTVLRAAPGARPGTKLPPAPAFHDPIRRGAHTASLRAGMRAGGEALGIVALVEALLLGFVHLVRRRRRARPRL